MVRYVLGSHGRSWLNASTFSIQYSYDIGMDNLDAFESHRRLQLNANIVELTKRVKNTHEYAPWGLKSCCVTVVTAGTRVIWSKQCWYVKAVLRASIGSPSTIIVSIGLNVHVQITKSRSFRAIRGICIPVVLKRQYFRAFYWFASSH